MRGINYGQTISYAFLHNKYCTVYDNYHIEDSNTKPDTGVRAVLTLSLALTSAPDLINSSATPTCFAAEAKCKGVDPYYNEGMRLNSDNYSSPTL